MSPRIRVKGVTIVSMDPAVGIIDSGDLLLDNGKIIAVDFEKGGASFIYKIAVDTGNASRLTDAKTGNELW